jgi:hypothetical protein
MTAIKGLGEAYQRHIVIDNIEKVIYIEVQTDLKGYPKAREYEDIANNGLWYKYVPANIRNDLSQAIANGYRITGVVNMGAKTEEYYVLQLIEIGKLQIIDPKKIPEA